MDATGSNVDQELWAQTLKDAWTRSKMKQVKGVRFSMATRKTMFNKAAAIAAKTQAGTPLHDKEKAWLTVLRMQFCNTLLGDGTWRLGLGELQSGPWE